MSVNRHGIDDLRQMQSLPLEAKITMTELRIRDWVEHFGEDGVYVSFSGGKDSTVLLTIARSLYPNLKACFADTGLEFPEIRKFVQTFDNVDIVRPKKNFKQICAEYGFPLISKEVSEVVPGARKYLTKALADNTLERTNERTNERQPYAYWFDRLTGQGQYERTRAPYRFEAEKLLGFGRRGKTDRQPSSAKASGDKQDGRKSDTGNYP
jgi:hypothetical protein